MAQTKARLPESEPETDNPDDSEGGSSGLLLSDRRFFLYHYQI